ncbi:hypothetical protein OIV41_32515, partial [Burkholderia pseudomallei]|nr:hypothetical protein [Burkholderia pseudomallei]
PKQIHQGWKSTEHNVDTYAVFRWLAERTGDARWRTAADRSRSFVAAMWDARQGRFLIGTRDDGHSPNVGPSALDASLWPLLAIADAPPDWRRSIAWVDSAHRINGGYGFNAHPDGVWTQGTGQAALTLQAVGQNAKVQPLWVLLLAQRAPERLLYATPDARISHGLSIGLTTQTEVVSYFPLPYLGPTALHCVASAVV